MIIIWNWQWNIRLPFDKVCLRCYVIAVEKLKFGYDECWLLIYERSAKIRGAKNVYNKGYQHWKNNHFWLKLLNNVIHASIVIVDLEAKNIITFRWWWRCWNEIWVSVVHGREGCLAMSLSSMVCNTVIYPPLERNMCCPCHVWLRWGWLTDGWICITID